MSSCCLLRNICSNYSTMLNQYPVMWEIILFWWNSLPNRLRKNCVLKKIPINSKKNLLIPKSIGHTTMTWRICVCNFVTIRWFVFELLCKIQINNRFRENCVLKKIPKNSKKILLIPKSIGHTTMTWRICVCNFVRIGWLFFELSCKIRFSR